MKSNNKKVVSTKDIIKEITALVAESIKDCYGVSENTKSAKKGKEESIVIKMHSDKTFDVSAFVCMAPSVKITEALYECQKIIKYRLDRKFPKACNKVNIFAMNISSK